MNSKEELQSNISIISIPNAKQRIKNILEIFEFDISTTRKYNKINCIIMWEIQKVLQEYDDKIPIENGDVFDWAVGRINFEKFKKYKK